MIIEGLLGVTFFLAMAMLAIYFYGRSCYQAGYEDGRAAAYGRKLAAARAERGRHAKSQPRALPSPAPAAAPRPREQPTRTALVRSGYRDSWRLPLEGSVPVMATDIQPVFLPPQPAPPVNGTDDTGTMTRVRLDSASTGEMRAVTDEWIAENCTEAEAIA